MRLALLLLVTAAVAFSLGSCSRAADRTLTIHQFASTDTYTGQFQMDTSQLPADAIKERTDTGPAGAPVTTLTLNQKYAVRVLIVPVVQPKAPKPAG